MLRLPLLLLAAVAAIATAAAAADPVAAPSDPFAPEAVFPSGPAPAVRSHQNVLNESMSWTDISLFSALVQTMIGLKALPAPPTGGAPFVVFAPTNEAFVKFLLGAVPPLDRFSDPAFVLGTFGRLQAAVADPQTPHKVVELLAGVLSYHIALGPDSETALQKAGTLPTLLTSVIPGATLDTAAFPRVTDAQNGTATRYARSLKLSDDALFVVIDRVLEPFSLEPVRALLFPPTNGSAAPPPLPGGLPQLPPQVQPYALPGGPSAPAPAPFAYPFASYAGFVAGRADLQIFRALVLADPVLAEALVSFNRTVHPLVPTDTAFANLVTQIGAPALTALAARFQHAPLDPTLLTQMVQTVQRVVSLLPGLPSVRDIISYHVLKGPADLPSRTGPQATLFGADTLTVVARDDGRVYVSDGDSSRGDAKVIATFPLLTGYVSVVDSVLLNFNVKATLAVLAANGGLGGAGAGAEDEPVPTPEADLNGESSDANAKAADDSGSCFPADATLTRADGTQVAMRDVVAGDAVHTDPAAASDAASSGNSAGAAADAASGTASAGGGGGSVAPASPGAASPLFLFSHRDLHTVAEFVRLETASGHVVRATPGHYARVDGRLRAFAHVRVGDRVRTTRGESAVVRTSRVVAPGLYAPHALDATGDLVVDGVLVSAYSTAVRPAVAQALLAPVRWASARFGLVEPIGRLLYGGADALLAVVPRGADVY